MPHSRFCWLSAQPAEKYSVCNLQYTLTSQLGIQQEKTGDCSPSAADKTMTMSHRVNLPRKEAPLRVSVGG